MKPKNKFEEAAHARWVIWWRWSILPGTVLVGLLAATGARLLGFDTNYRVFLREEGCLAG